MKFETILGTQILKGNFKIENGKIIIMLPVGTYNLPKQKELPKEVVLKGGESS